MKNTFLPTGKAVLTTSPEKVLSKVCFFAQSPKKISGDFLNGKKYLKNFFQTRRINLDKPAKDNLGIKTSFFAVFDRDIYIALLSDLSKKSSSKVRKTMINVSTYLQYF